MDFEEMVGFMAPVVLLALIAAVVYLVATFRRRRSRVDTGIGTVRRLYYYAVCLTTLMMTASGVIMVGSDLLDRLFAGAPVSTSTTGLAWGLALVIIGLPLWAFHWRAMTRHVADLPVETSSELRKIYIYVVLGFALTLTLLSAFGLLEQIFRNADFSGFPWSAMLVSLVVWMYHWRLENHEGQDTAETVAIRRFYLYVASVVTLTSLAVGAGTGTHIILTEGYASAFSMPVIVLDEAGIWRPALRGALAMLIVGGAGWAAHWLWFARRDADSALRWVYIYAFAILGGIITSMVAAGILLHGILTWAFGAPGTESAVDHFDFLPGVIASLSIGGAVWVYHWWTAQVEAEADTSAGVELATKRAYDYIVAFLGLGALAAASFTILNTALTLITESTRGLISGENLWQEPVAISITLAAVGAPLWGYYWRGAQRRAALDNDLGERTALARKIFVFVVLGTGVLALVGSASATLFVILHDLLDVSLSLDTVRDIRPAVGVALTAAFILQYQWSVYRSDRLAEPEEEREIRQRKPVSVLVQEGSQELLERIEDALGYPVETLTWADIEAVTPTLSEDALLELASRVADAQGCSVLIVPDGTGVRVLSYD